MYDSGKQSDWDKLWNKYASEINANGLSTIRYGLSCAKDQSILKSYLNKIRDENIIRLQDKHTAINQVSSSVYGRDLAWEFVVDNWDWFYDM